MQELRVAARGLLASPLFTLACVITLALGIGSTTALFSVVDAVLLKPLPYPDPDRLVRIFATGTMMTSSAYPDFAEWKSSSKSIASFGGFMRWSYNLAGEGRPQRAWGGIVTRDVFQTMGVRPLLGRVFTPEEDQPGGEKVVVLSHALWRSLFAGAPDVLGRKLRLDDIEHRIVGVMPPGFELPSDARLWTPLALGLETHPRGMRFLRVVARLAPGATLDQAQAELSTIMRRLEKEFPDTNAGLGVELQPLREQGVSEVRRALWIILGAAGLVLLIACSNVMNLMLARFADRRGEMALRRVLGASRFRLFVRCFADALLLTAVGGTLGVVLAHWGVKVLVALHMAQQNPSFLAERLHDIPRLAEAGVDGRVLAFALLLSLATALVVSLVPALQLSERNLSGTFAGEKGTVGSGGRLRHLFVVAEVAIALSLVIGAGLLIRSFSSLLRIDPGFRSDNVLTLQVSLPVTKYTESSQTTAFYSELLDRIEAMPDVESAGMTWGLPLSGLGGATEFEVEGNRAGAAGDRLVGVQPVSERYFETLGIPLRKGRSFTDRDTPDGLPVVIINEAMARRFWPGENPIGKRIDFSSFFGPVGALPPGKREIVGVVADTKRTGLAQDAEAEMYVPYRQTTWRLMTLAVRSRTDPAMLARSLEKAVWAIDADLPVADMKTMDELVSQATSRPRFNTALLAIFAGSALILAIVGIYGIISYSVSARTHEIGIRMALGAKPQHIVRQVLRQGVVLTAVGLLIGIAIAFALTRLLSALLFGIAPNDPVTFVLVSLVFLLMGSLASYWPARRATRIDPLVALRTE